MSLSKLTHEQYLAVVNDDVRDKARQDQSRALREDPTPWHNALLELKRSCETQLADDKALRSEKRLKCMALGEDGKEQWAKFLAERDRWRAGIIRFKNGIENKLVEAYYLKGQEPSLRAAIIAHKDVVLNGEDDLDDADERLWSKVGL